VTRGCKALIPKAPQFHSFTVSQNGRGGGSRTVVSGWWLVVRKAGKTLAGELLSVVRERAVRGLGNGVGAILVCAVFEERIME